MKTDPVELRKDSQLRALVAQQPFFNGLHACQIELLAQAAMVKQFAASEWIFRQGDPANRFYIILEGKVLIESEVKNRGLIPIRTLGPADDLGWAWLFPPYYMHFSACAVEPTKAIFFYATHLRERCEENHEFGYQLMKRIAHVVVQNLNATQQLLLEYSEFKSFSERREIPADKGHVKP
jgi:CRP/FNR family transcriptional regulator, cyclic AMP receptor protein